MRPTYAVLAVFSIALFITSMIYGDKVLKTYSDYVLAMCGAPCAQQACK